MGYIQKIATSLFLFFVLFLSFSEQANAEWVDMSGNPGSENISQNSNYNYSGRVVLDSDNNPFSVWNNSGDGQIYLTRWNGSTWVDMNGNPGIENISQNSDYNYEPQIVFDSDGNPIIIWTDDDDGQIHLTRWDGSTWVDMSGNPGIENVSQNSDYNYKSQISLDSDGHPIVLWSDNDDGQIYLTHWNGSTWVGMSGNPGSENISQNSDFNQPPQVVSDPEGYPIVIWSSWNYTSNGIIHLTRWNGVEWTDMGGNPGYENIAQNSDNNYEPHVSLDSEGRPTIVWEYGSGGQIYLTRWDGSQWTDMSGNPGIENISQNSDYNYEPQIILDSNDDPFVIWSENDGQIYLTRWNGSTWVDMSGNPGSENISQNSDYNYEPQITLDLDGNPITVWSDDDDGQIYLTRWFSSVRATGFIPQDNATNVSATPTFSITFDESVERGTGAIFIKKVSDDSIFESIDIFSSQISGWGTDTLTFTSNSPLEYGTQYAINISENAIVGQSGNLFPGITDSEVWDFFTRSQITEYSFFDTFDSIQFIDEDVTSAHVDMDQGNV